MATPRSLHQPSHSRSSSANRRKDEELFDKFSTLFTPSTPRASPTPEAAFLQPPNYSRARSSNEHPHGSTLLPVSKTEDPLAILSPTPVSPSFSGVPFHPAAAPFKKSSNNPTFNYFERFGQDAKTAVDHRNKTLEELLSHQDDPLYWIRRDEDGSRTPEPAADPTPDLVDLTSDVQVPSATKQESDAGPPPTTFDEDYFSRRSVTSSVRASPDIRHSPARSTSVLIPTPAPPVESVSPAAPGFSTPPTHDEPISGTNRRSRSSSGSPRPTPYATLSTLSSKFMSSLLPSAGNLPQAPFAPFSKPPLDTLFAPNDNSRPSLHRTSSSEHASSPVLRRPSHAASSSDLQITHGTPFGPSSKPSPFAAHVYIPPTGAPGYAGEQYDWDKGFSNELEQEVKAGRNGKTKTDGKAKTMAKALGSDASKDGRNARGGEGKPGGVIKVIDKKTGAVELLQRRDSTDPVLDADLAELIRAHLPALARLPRKWNLVYSLDQHGISLNTLYTRCEAATQPVKPGAPTPAGCLLVIRDAEDGLFGAWTGKEGIHLSKGGYYGSGESFLWRYVSDQLQIFSWTGKNEYVALCEPDFISFGGGDGNYGLYLDDTLFEGSSARCPTFANEPLCSPGPKKAGVVAFECVGLEVWAVGP